MRVTIEDYRSRCTEAERDAIAAWVNERGLGKATGVARVADGRLSFMVYATDDDGHIRVSEHGWPVRKVELIEDDGTFPWPAFIGT